MVITIPIPIEVVNYLQRVFGKDSTVNAKVTVIGSFDEAQRLGIHSRIIKRYGFSLIGAIYVDFGILEDGNLKEDILILRYDSTRVLLDYQMSDFLFHNEIILTIKYKLEDAGFEILEQEFLHPIIPEVDVEYIIEQQLKPIQTEPSVGRFDVLDIEQNPYYEPNEFVYRLHSIKIVPAPTHTIRKLEDHPDHKLNWTPMYEQEWAGQYKTFVIRAGQTILALTAISAEQPAKDEAGEKYLHLERLERHPEAPKIPGAGIIALMKLIQLSKEYGFGGALMLTALPSAATFYEKIGMKKIGEEYMSEEIYPVFVFNRYAAQDFLMWARRYLIDEKKVARNPDLLYADFTSSTIDESYDL